ncbi:HPP family protein [Umezawaea endophytica]|uniref:CBS domain-containing protein n=1 Tax=Umezawaea endophytica TaxID=1654476 RepID=A0A9X2VXP4_9PSEU|nr:CBS domain-containing protein [Umezawaea endophytica]MCS7484743.1 CBS domain-containing protein [Umezawaea endophytica]
MRAKDIMTQPAVTVTPDVPIREAAALLVSHGFTALPVVDAERRMVGIVTEADLLHSRYDTRPESPGAPVEQVMTTPAFGMGVGSSVELLARVMLDDRVRSLPIIDGSRVVGVVTRRDLVRALARTDSAIAADVRHRLEVYGGPDEWSVSVHDGEVTIDTEFADAEFQRVVAALAEGVLGVATATVRTGKDLP